MSVKVRIPTPLRRVTGGADVVEVDAGNLEQIIAALNGEHPGIKERLCDEQGGLRSFVNVYVNGEDVRFLQGLDTGTNDGDEISIVPAVAGG